MMLMFITTVKKTILKETGFLTINNVKTLLIQRRKSPDEVTELISILHTFQKDLNKTVSHYG